MLPAAGSGGRGTRGWEKARRPAEAKSGQGTGLGLTLNTRMVSCADLLDTAKAERETEPAAGAWVSATPRVVTWVGAGQMGFGKADGLKIS